MMRVFGVLIVAVAAVSAISDVSAATLNVDVQTSTVQNAIIHAGSDFTKQYSVTGQTVNYGSIESGALWINNYQQVSVLNATSVTTVESPSPCAESSAMHVTVNGTGTTLFLFHGNTMQCSCEWSPQAPCPPKLRVEVTGSDAPPIEYFISVRNGLSCTLTHITYHIIDVRCVLMLFVKVNADVYT